MADLGLRESYFDAAISSGLDAAARATPAHPKIFGGWLLWAETTAGLRTVLLSLDREWQIGQTRGYETSYHLGHNIAIVVVGGDANTGVVGFKPPKTRRKRGPVTAKRVSRNIIEGQMALSPDLEPPVDDEGCVTWFLLLKERNGSLYRELSLPMSMGADGKIALWRERIILEPMQLNGISLDDHHDDDNGDEPQIHVGRK
ncbi:hypothetical protein [Catellatospora methionotrophica]|uniref:hypothetical protein n=1 Tax=Catellatospora methionotrophica TaxID=121620 RepID=UPI00140CCA6B|nr:hypothetical protein [Catellatospora methionotrophica]